jgi:hypothetical protein
METGISISGLHFACEGARPNMLMPDFFIDWRILIAKKFFAIKLNFNLTSSIPQHNVTMLRQM